MPIKEHNYTLRDNAADSRIAFKCGELKNWRSRLNYYAFVAGLLGEGDIYPPTEYARPVSRNEVVRAWKGTVASIRKGKAPKQLGMFIFVPFCRTKCLFCPFFSFALSSPEQLDVYTQSLLAEMDLFKGVFKGVKFNTLWFGGGTPSVLEQKHLKAIFGRMYKLFSFTKDAQITFECSCSSTDRDKLKLLHSLGVNRVTLGIQSLNDRVLKINNRLYQNRAASIQLIKDAKRAGIDVVNIDLMCGLPGDSLDSFLKGLRTIISLKPELIHINPFFPSNETNFYRGNREYSNDDMERRTMEADLGMKILMESGYKRAEGAFLGFARVEGVGNQQEIDRVRFTSSYLSFGPSAESHAFGQMDYTNAYFGRQWNAPVAPNYIGCDFDVPEEMRKHMVSNLRYPIYRRNFHKLFGKDIVKVFRKELDQLLKFDLVHIDDEKVFFKIRTRQEQLILAKHFFSSRFLKGLEKKFKTRFDPQKNYFRDIAKLIDISV